MNDTQQLKDLADYGTSADTQIRDLIKHWEYDLDALRPGKAVAEYGATSITDADLSSLLSALAKRNANRVKSI